MKFEKKKNVILADHGDWLEIDVSTAKHISAIMFIDKIDWEHLCKVGIGRIRAVDNTYGCQYAQFSISEKNIRLHNFLLGVKYIDHIDHNPLNNRRYNLRKATYSQNNINHRLRSDSSSGIKGVSRRGDKWRARVTIKGVETYLGLFLTKEEARDAYCAAAKKIHGEFFCAG